MSGELTTVADLLTQQFYDWEIRGRGWVLFEAPVELEPPFRPFEGHTITHEMVDDGLQETGLSLVAKGLKNLFGPAQRNAVPPIPRPAIEEPGPRFIAEPDERIELVVALPPKYEPSSTIFAECLLSLSETRTALSFEIIATHEGIVTVISAAVEEAEFVFGQLKAHFPEAVVVGTQNTLSKAWEECSGDQYRIHEFGLADEFMIPIRTCKQLATDPLVSLCGAFEHLREDELGVFQVLFKPATSPWVRSMRAAVTTSNGQPFFENAPELVSLTRQKTTYPLYSVVVRVAVCSNERTDVLLRQLSGVMRLFGHHDTNALLQLNNEDYPADKHLDDLLNRTTHRSGMLLNSEELVSLVHLPSSAVRSKKLHRETKHTKAAPTSLLNHELQLGENNHEGKTVRPTLSTEHRLRHLHLIGASGTGKSTLLLNLVCQDIYQGNGLAVIDPHGDLIEQIEAYIPPERMLETILIDPADGEYPVGLNLLSASTDEEKNLLASDLVAVFRRLSTSWGDQMNSVLGNAILAFLESNKGGTLADLRRFLIESAYRREFLTMVKDPEVVYYWQKEFPLLKGGSLGPLMTRLDAFLRPKAIRYMVAQKVNKIDFTGAMNEGRIVLVKLSQGLIGEENASLLGSLLVSKFHQLAIARQSLTREQRRPFFLYLDEFQHFVSPSMEAILSGARKYGLGLTLAHQDLRQLARDAELTSSVMANAATRICFRVGDNDAEKLAAGFADFSANDLRQLDTGEAICRVERSDHDFNLNTHLPPEVDPDSAEERRAHLRRLSREAYGTLRSDVEAELEKSRVPVEKEQVDPFTRRTKKTEKQTTHTEDPPSVVPTHATTQKTKPVPPPPLPNPMEAFTSARVPKLGSAEDREHRKWQYQIAVVGQQRGWRSQMEAPLAEHGNADVLLTKNKFRIACEVALTSPPEYEVQSISKRVAAGMTHVVVISTKEEHLAKIETLARNSFGKAVGDTILFGSPDIVGALLDQLDASQSGGEEVIGEMHVRYQSKVVTPEEQHRRTSMLNTALKRLKAGGRRSRS